MEGAGPERAAPAAEKIVACPARPAKGWGIPSPASTDSARSRSAARTALVFLAAAAILYARLLYLADYFPPLHEGEQAQPLIAAQGAYESIADTHSLYDVVVGGHMSYNKGYFAALLPAYGVFGYDARILTYGMPVFFGAYLGTMFILYRKAYPKASLLAFVLIAVMPVLCGALRRTKWHTIAYIPPLAILIFFLPEWREGLAPRQRKSARLAGIGAFAVSCYLYFGCFLYCLPFALLLAYFGRRQGRRFLVPGLIGGAVLASAFSYFCYVNPVWSGRIENEWGFMKTLFSRDGLGLRWLYIRQYYWQVLSPPYLLFYFAGLAFLFVRARRGDRFALIAGVLYVPLWVFQLLLEGPNNPDQLNWTMIPSLLVLLAGADTLLRLVRERLPAGRWLAIAVVAVLSWRETDRFPDYVRDYADEFWTQIRDTKSQAALVLRMIAEDRSGQVRYFLPDPAVTEADGGFGYDVSLLRPEFTEALSRVNFFTSEADLRRRILLGPRKKWAVVYLSAIYPPDATSPDKSDPALKGILGLAPEWIHPYEDVYRNPFLVRKFMVRPEQLGPAPAPRA